MVRVKIVRCLQYNEMSLYFRYVMDRVPVSVDSVGVLGSLRDHFASNVQ